MFCVSTSWRYLHNILYTSMKNVYNGQRSREPRLLIDGSKEPIVTVPRFKVDIDECYCKQGTDLKLFWRVPRHQIYTFCYGMLSLVGHGIYYQTWKALWKIKALPNNPCVLVVCRKKFTAKLQ